MHSVQAMPGQSPFVTIHLTHNLTANRIPEIRFDLDLTIGQVKEHIEKRYGTSVEHMELILQDTCGGTIGNLANDEKPLSFYDPQDNYTIHVIDKNPNSVLKGIDDLSKVDKYTMSEQDYDNLSDNFRKFKTKLLENNPELGKLNPTVVVIIDDDYLQDVAATINIGDRCQVKETKHRGEIKYVGRIPNLGQGFYVGIQLDEPYGKHSGKVGPVQYFTCPDKYGLFVRPDKVEIGDFPELDLDDFGDDEDEV